MTRTRKFTEAIKERLQEQAHQALARQQSVTSFCKEFGGAYNLNHETVRKALIEIGLHSHFTAEGYRTFTQAPEAPIETRETSFPLNALVDYVQGLEAKLEGLKDVHKEVERLNKRVAELEEIEREHNVLLGIIDNRRTKAPTNVYTLDRQGVPHIKYDHHELAGERA